MDNHFDMIAPIMGTVSGISAAITEQDVTGTISVIVAIICGITTVAQTCIKCYRAIRRQLLQKRASKARERSGEDA